AHRVCARVLTTPPAESSRRRPATPAMTDAVATDPDRMRKLRRDQLGMDPAASVPPEATERDTAGPSSHESASMPTNAATPATIACGAADTGGSPSAAKNPSAANTPIVPAPRTNDRRAAIPAGAPHSRAAGRGTHYRDSVVC